MSPIYMLLLRCLVVVSNLCSHVQGVMIVVYIRVAEL